MKEFVELIERLEKELYLADKDKKEANVLQLDRAIGYGNGIAVALEIVNQLAEEYNGNWITDRTPTKEECGGWRGTFQATILQGIGDKQYTTTVALQYEYTTVRGKEVSRWLFKEKISPWEPIAWKHLSEPYQL